MPKQTFLNLPEEKRDHILQVAIGEFAAKGYGLASISRIVAEAGIAKGSFYQYFEDKDDLYCYIVTEFVAERKILVYEQEKDRLLDLSLTQFLRVVFHRQVQEFSQNPALYKIALELLRLSGQPVYTRIMAQYQDTVDDYFLPFIQYEVDQGEIDPAVNRRLLNFMLVSVGQYLVSVMNTGNLETVSHELIDQLVDDLEYIFIHGIYLEGGHSLERRPGNP